MVRGIAPLDPVLTMTDNGGMVFGMTLHATHPENPQTVTTEWTDAESLSIGTTQDDAKVTLAMIIDGHHIGVIMDPATAREVAEGLVEVADACKEGDSNER